MFVEELETIAKTNDWIKGAYSVYFHKPVKNFKTIRAELKEIILDYVRSTKDLQSAPAFDYLTDYFPICTISKIHNNKDIIYPGLPAFAKFEGQSTRESLALLAERLKDKTQKLRKISSPIILLILDTNLLFPNDKAFTDANPLLPDISNFHTVFIISPAFGDFILLSQNSDWMNRPELNS